MASSWMDDAEEVTTSDWMKDAEEVKPEVSALESFGRGGLQSATLGFSDEGIGGVQAAYEKLKGAPEDFSSLYEKFKGESREANRAAEEANPVAFGAGQVGGGVGTALIPGLGGAKLASLIGQGALTGLGASESEDAIQQAKDAALGGVLGGTLGLAGKGLSSAATAMAPKVKALGSSLGKSAEKLAINATGATQREAEKFAPNAGRELLDRGLVRFFDTAENVGQRTGEGLKKATSEMDKALGALESQGVTASPENIVQSLTNKIGELKSDPSQAGVVRKLSTVLEDIVGQGTEPLPLSKAEQIKRGFNKSAGNWLDPEAGVAGKEAYRAYKNEVERVAREASPEISGAFEKAKKDFGLLKPINEAAERRAGVLNQSPFGGLGDTAAAAVSTAGGPAVQVATAAGRRLVSPRISSSSAVLVDGLAETLKTAPERFGKYARPLMNAAQRGSSALGATNFVLMQSDPEYRKMMMESEEDLNNE